MDLQDLFSTVYKKVDILSFFILAYKLDSLIFTFLSCSSWLSAFECMIYRQVKLLIYRQVKLLMLKLDNRIFCANVCKYYFSIILLGLVNLAAWKAFYYGIFTFYYYRKHELIRLWE